MDYAEEIVLPAFLNKNHIRKHGETEFRFYGVELRKLGEIDGEPIIAIAGHFVKDTMLRRHQIFRADRGLVASEAEIESAPSAFFVLILNNHRLLYLAETAGAPSLESFGATAQSFMREEWTRYLREQMAHENITRRGVESLSLKAMRNRIPTPVLAVVRVAGEDAITESIARFGKITQIRLKLIEPNDETDASEAISAVEEAFRPTEPARLEIIASQPKGLNRDEVHSAILDAAEGQNTEIIVDGLDEDGLKMKADNDEFALSTQIEDVPQDDGLLAKRLYERYQELVEDAKLKGVVAMERIAEKLARLAGLL